MSYHRINIDGKSITETCILAGALYPGQFAVLDGNNEFIAATAGDSGRLYVINPAYHEGGTIDDQLAIGQSGVGEYVEEGRELVVRVAAGNYTKDAPIYVGAGGIASLSGDQIVGFCQDDTTLATTGFIRIRIRAVLVAPSVVSVTINEPESTDVKNGATLALTAKVSPAAADQRVTWSSGSTGVFTIDASTGVATAVAASGTSVITATSVADNAKTATITLTAIAA